MITPDNPAWHWADAQRADLHPWRVPDEAPYTIPDLYVLAQAISPSSAPSKKTLCNKLPASKRTKHYLRDLPLIKAAFPNVAWPEDYREVLAQLSKRETD